MKLFVPGAKRKAFRNACLRLLHRQENGLPAKLRTLSSIVGKLQSLARDAFLSIAPAGLSSVNPRSSNVENTLDLWESIIFLSAQAMGRFNGGSSG